MQIQNKIVLSLISVSVLSMGLHAADWLSIAGTQPSFVKKDGKKVANHNNKPHFWGFIQAGYQKDYGTILDKAGTNKTPFVMLAPSLDHQSGFEINRARLAVRGMVDKDNQLDYFFMTEFGEDGVTEPAGHPTHNYLTDASITYNGIPYVHVRAGQFKYPGSEEGMRAVFASEYRNFSTAGNQLLLERFLPNNAKETVAGSGIYQGDTEQSVGAYRDRGVELFNTTHIRKNITVSVAGMVGNGTGLSSKNASGNMTYYGYLASEYLFGKGKGYYTQSVKVYGWYQNGARRLNNKNYDRTRYGAGVDYFHNGLRVDVEYIKAKGMIYNGAKDVDADPYNNDWQYQIAAESKNEADGGFVSAQYYVLPKKVELLARYDYLNRLTNLKSQGGERDYKTTTLGMSYHFKGPNRIDVNYAFRDFDAPGNAVAQKVVDNMGNLLSIQGTIKF
ncbi:hypothetical protein [Sulfurimonas sp.]|uniref:hypothetical protein n=1 Tax=Sulfurimonas sp. TaxID=2022749 RepID=UPI002618161B|nr:hypothetical protein [Sulfurimonas sp.]